MAGALVISTVIPRLALRGTKKYMRAATPASHRLPLVETPGLLAKLLLPMFVTSIGAGLIHAFMNIFFSNVHQQPDPVIGALMA